MPGYRAMLAELRANPLAFTHLDAAQLVKHAFALRTAVQTGSQVRKQPMLYYLYAEPASWPGGRRIPTEAHTAHRAEIERFAKQVESDEVRFHACSYRELLAAWQTEGDVAASAHAEAILLRFPVC